MTTPPPQFGSDFDHIIKRDGQGEAAFGRNVLDALITPLREAVARRRSERSWGPGVLGCAMWMDDPELIDALGRMANACVVITKQQSYKYKKENFKRVENLARTNGLAQRAYPELEDLAPKAEFGSAFPLHGMDSEGANIGAVRELGFRKIGDRLVPIVHAKMLLLGRMGWTDEHPSGHVMDILYFVPERLWIGSANFTASSRQSLEMGMWTTDSDLLTAARDWLLRLVAMSEPLRSASDDSDPELVPVEFDEVAIADYMRHRDFDFDFDFDDD